MTNEQIKALADRIADETSAPCQWAEAYDTALAAIKATLEIVAPVAAQAMTETELFELMKEIDPETKRVPIGIMRLVVKLEERIRAQLAAISSVEASK